MTVFSRTFNGPARLFTLFLVSAGVVLSAIGWLGWRLLSQERLLDEQRMRDQLENTASLATRELERTLAEWDDRLAKLADGQSVTIPPRASAFLAAAQGVRGRAGVSLPFYPRVSAPTDTSSALFADAEALEFGRGNVAGAQDIYRRLANSSQPSIRAAALMRFARTLRRQQRTQEAIEAYQELALVGPDAWVAGAPAELVARRERIALFDSIGDAASARAEAQALGESLWSGRHAIDRATFDFYADGIAAPAEYRQSILLAKSLEELWPAIVREEKGRAASSHDSGSVVAQWRTTGGERAVVIGELSSMVPAVGTLNLAGFSVVLQDDEGHVAWGTAGNGAAAVRTARQTGLPWTVRAVAADDGTTARLARSRRLLLIAGCVLVMLLATISGIVMLRAVSHELNVARLQSEFVATVSHEFRTPLTAMRHLTEMLDEGQVNAARVPLYYKALVKETRRLQGLVESLLDFGRTEAGRRTYHMEASEPLAAVRQVVDEFADSPANRRIELDGSRADADSTIHIDREALGLALRNLIDNALKYSAADAPVRVSVAVDSAHVEIEVTDQGPGIPVGEQRQIFRKFFRGSAAAGGAVKGTGIGLAIADHIVRAHGGSLRLRSELGQGSSFAIVLPVAPRDAGIPMPGFAEGRSLKREA